MFVNRWDGNFKQLRHQILRQPDGLILIANLNSSLARLTGEDQNLRRTAVDRQIF